MKLKKFDGRSRDTAEIITDLLYEHKFVLGGERNLQITCGDITCLRLLVSIVLSTQTLV